MAQYLLGISCYYHDASAALLKDGVVIAAAQEERFTRKKHDSSFPKEAIAFCLRQANIAMSDIDKVCFYEKPFLKFERVIFQHLAMFPKSLKTFLSSMPSWLNEKLRVTRAVRKLGYRKGVLFVPHHLAHAATFFLSPFDEAAILTVDGVGEWTTTAYGKGCGTEISLLKEIRFPHSLGLLYSAVTAYLGFSVNNSEYKVMGLSAYGEHDRTRNEYYQKLKKVIDIKSDGSYALDMTYFRYHYADRMINEKFCSLLGGPVRKESEAVTERHEDIAAAVQLVMEEVMDGILAHLHRETGLSSLIMGGGIALNSVYNGKILSRTPFKNLWIQPDPGDGGTSIGAASYVWHTLLKKPRQTLLKTPYLGPSYSRHEIEGFLKENDIAYTEFRDDQIVRETAKLIYENRVVGWFQLGMEWGPRALGARSILANPINPEAQELLNTKVKHRERFRPFAPVVTAEDADTYFECDQPLPQIADYMLMVYPVREKWRQKIPAVTHVDGTGRLQTVKHADHALYYDLLKEFGRLSGIPILINTSFNIRGEPIVCSPWDAYKCMMGTGIDCLVIGNFLVRREDNLRDMWDSEKYAHD